jgi:hypothetical protein
MRSSIGEGLRFLWQHRIIRGLTLAGIGNSFTGGAVVGLTVVFGVIQLGLSADDARLGLLYTAGAVGSLGASLLLPRLVQRISIPRLTVLALGLSTLMVVLISQSKSFAAGCIALLGFQFGSQLTIQNGIAFRQSETPDSLQARVNVVARMIAWGGFPLGGAIGGALASVMPVESALLVVGVGLGISLLYGVLGPLGFGTTRLRA